MEPDRQHPEQRRPGEEEQRVEDRPDGHATGGGQAADGGSRPLTVPTAITRFLAEYRLSSPNAPHTATPSSCSAGLAARRRQDRGQGHGCAGPASAPRLARS